MKRLIVGAVAIEEFIQIDKRIDEAEEQASDRLRESIRDRWEFGRLMLAERKGKQLPKGVLDKLAEATGKSRQELGYRMRFAETYPSEDELATALATFTSWTQIKRNLPKPPPPPQKKPQPQPQPQPTPQRDKVAGQEVVAINWDSLPKTAKDREAVMRRVVRKELETKLRAEYGSLVEAEVERRVRPWQEMANETHAKARRVLDARKGIMTKADYDVIRACLHPDSRLSTSDEKLNRAFDVFNRLELLFLNEADFPTTKLPSPEELKKRRRGAKS